MSLPFRSQPGMFERHLKRQHQNPLFGSPEINLAQLEAAQQRDDEHHQAFMQEFEKLVKQAVALDTNTEADIVLGLKENLDKAYEQCCSLAGDLEEIKEMIRKLVAAVMRAMWNGVGADIQAQGKLRMEQEARDAHYALLEHHLIGDLLSPESPIEESQLVTSLLSDSIDAASLAMQLFVPEQQAEILSEAQQRVHALQDTAAQERASERLQALHNGLQPHNTNPF